MTNLTTGPVPEHARRTDRIIAILLFAGLSFVYFATVSGITSSNDGSHHALLRTMIANRTFTLNQFDDYAEGNDIALTPDGRLFSDRPPGTAVAAIPVFVLGGPLPDATTPLPSRHDASNPRLPYVLLLPVFAGAGTAVILFGMLRQLEIARAAAVTAVVFFGLGTIHWKYSTVLFSHALSGFLLILSVYLVLLMVDRDIRHWAYYLLLGFALGASVVVEYSNALAVLVLFVFWLLRSWPLALRRPLTTLLPWAAGGLIPILFLAWYNTVNFGSPLTVSYAYAVNYPWAGTFGGTFSFPLLAGLRALLWWGEGGGWCGGPPCVNQGLFLLSPVLLLALPGLPIYYRRRTSWFTLTTVLFLVYLLLFAKHHTSHGFTADGRYLAPFLGLLVPALGFTLDWLIAPQRGAGVRAVAVFVVYGLFFLSLRNQFLHIGTSYNYMLDLAQLQTPLARPENALYLLGSVFPNAGNWRLLVFVWGLFLVLAGLLLGARRLLRR